MARIQTHPILAIPGTATVSFTFAGRELSARRGEMIASALFAHGIHVFNRHPEDGRPQGIFCANGQCAQCLVLADGRPVKGCMTPVREGMRVEPLTSLPHLPEPVPADSATAAEPPTLTCDLLVIGAGPAGLGAAIEAADAGLGVLLVDDKEALGGKLLLQTHMFFGDVDRCHAGTRGLDIAGILAAEVRRRPAIRVMTATMVVGVFSDGLIGAVQGEGRYLLIRPRSLLVATGAREKALAFPGCDLPGVYGAGAFQTLLNRDLIQPAQRLFVVGGGNVGLIAAYHALQADIPVVGLAEALPEVGGYWVHADKLRRFGVPIYTSTTVVAANGRDAVESVTVAEVDGRWQIKPGSYRTYPCDTLLLAVGLTRINELYETAKAFQFDAHVAGDAEEIAEASAALFSGRLAGRAIARSQGRQVTVPEEWQKLVAVLKSKPGRDDLPAPERPAGASLFPLIWCHESIPCNPCSVVCPQGALTMPEPGDILPRASFDGVCRACGKCVAACPGLAITLVDLRRESEGLARVTLPYEFNANFAPGHRLTMVDRQGTALCEGTVVALTDKQSRAPCSAACPAGVHAQGYIELIRKGRFREAIELLRADLPLPSVCGRVCYHPCEEQCGRAELDEAVAIGDLKRFVADWARTHDVPVAPPPRLHPERVAVLGSGPSGLACANALRRRGYPVTVFESRPAAGGMLRYGIPEYRLPAEILDWELDCLSRLGIEILVNQKVANFATLREQGYAAIYLAVGAAHGAPLGIPGDDLPGVTDALTFLRQASGRETAPDLAGQDVVVIGGGNSAMDAARTARRLGAASVEVVYRRSRAEMPAHAWEVAEAEQEGVKFAFLLAPVRLESANGGVNLICTRMALGEPDASGRRRPVPVPDSAHVLKAGLVIAAVGQRPELGSLAAELGVAADALPAADPLTQATAVPGVFAGGDVVTGPATVVEAFAAGKRAAESIDRFLQGADLAAERGRPVAVSQAEASATEPQKRLQPARRPPSERVRSFAEVVAALTEDEAVREASRCLGCGAYCETLRAARDATRITREQTVLVTVEVPAKQATAIVGIRVQDEAVTKPIATVMPPLDDDDVIVCRCERVTQGQIRRALRAGVRDMNQLKAMLKVGMGACGGKTCGPLVQSLMRREGIPPEEIVDFTRRPLETEVPLGLFAGLGTVPPPAAPAAPDEFLT